MAAAMRRIGEYVKLVDVVIEVIDARVPQSGSNPMLDSVAQRRARITVLSREDLAEPAETSLWLKHIDRGAVAVNALTRGSFVKLKASLRAAIAGGHKVRRAMVVGIPNSGKSSIINGLVGRSVARTEDRAGVTRQLQWFKLGPQIELMDTPGILVPKIATEEAQWKLALVGAVPRDHYDPEEVVTRFYQWATGKRCGRTKVPDLATFAEARGSLRRGGKADL
ncbi:MAG TPA: GTPase, partial [Candidatus Rubrimentiphilum sp.]|nr:GTPase [Candidatus Rubrimentiphilum sp.]